MDNSIFRRVVAATTIAALSVGLTSCAAPQTEPESNEVLPPVIAETNQLEGTKFEITEKQPLVINAEDPTEWTGDVSDQSVAQFFLGTDDGMMQTNPGFKALSPGSTEAWVTSPNNETYQFTIVVN